MLKFHLNYLLPFITITVEWCILYSWQMIYVMEVLVLIVLFYYYYYYDDDDDDDCFILIVLIDRCRTVIIFSLLCAKQWFYVFVVGQY